MTCLIFVEGVDDGALMRLALDDMAAQRTFQIIVADGANAARPMARRALLTSTDPVILVTDADTTDRAAALARARDLNDYLAWSAGDKPYKLIQFVPESEVVFFEVPGLLENVLGKPVDPVFMKIGEDAPKKVMSVLGTSVRQIASAPVDAALVTRLREHPLLAEIREFVQTHAPQPSPQPG
jgi:hypothetical protein